MKIVAIETRTYQYEPDLEKDEFYTERDVKTIEGALHADKEFFEAHGTKEMNDLDDTPTIEVKWQLVGDDGSVIATF